MLNDLELYVYDAVASVDKSGGAVGEAEIVEIAADAGCGEEEVWRALSHLTDLNHVRASETGYVLGPHDWAP